MSEINIDSLPKAYLINDNDSLLLEQTAGTRLLGIETLDARYVNTTEIGVLTGPKGDKGDKGDKGPKGNKGDKGDKGLTGEFDPLTIFEELKTINKTLIAAINEINDKTGPVNIPVKSISLNKISHTFIDFSTLTLRATILPIDATNQNIIWTSSNTEVATVNNDGIVVAKANGSCIITATTQDGNKTANCNIRVSTPVYEFDIVAGTYTGSRNDIVLISGVCTYPNIDYWEVSSPDGWIGVANRFTNGKFELEIPRTIVVKTYNNCVIEARRNAIVPGTPDEIVAVASNRFTLIIQEEDIPPPTIPVSSISLNKTSHVFNSLETLQLSASIAPPNATNKNIEWTSSNNNIATVSSNGLVTAKANGNCTITVRTVSGNKTATCNISINIPTYEFDIVTKIYTGIKNNIVLIDGVCTYPDIDYWEVNSPDGWIGIANRFTGGKFELEIPSSLMAGTYNNCYMMAKRNAIPPNTFDTIVATSRKQFTLIVEDEVIIIPTTSIDVKPNGGEIAVGNTLKLNATVLPANATNKTVTWTSPNPNIATVDSNGLIRGINPGGVWIKVYQGNIYKEVWITVKAPAPPSNKNKYHSIAFPAYPHKNYTDLLVGLDMFKDYDYESALICLAVDCSFSNNNPFCDVTEANINMICNKVESLGLKPILKMHTVSLESDGQGNIDTPNNAATWFANYRTLVNKYADIAVKRGYKEFIISNEMHNVMNKASWKNLFTPTISDVKAKGLKVSMSMNTPEVRENDGFQFFNELDFYCMNTYPQLTRNGVAWARDNFEQLREGFYTPISNIDINYGELFKTMGGSNNSHKEIWLTEVGCINKEKGLEYPAFWGTDSSNPRNDEAQELWLKAVFDVLEKDKANGKLSNRVTKYMLWDGNSDSNFNPVNKRGKVVLDTYWKTSTPSDIRVTSVSLNVTNKTMDVDDRLNLIATITPSNATNKNISWATSNSKVATVNDSGQVIAKSEGTAIIIVRTQDGDKTASCNITVRGGTLPPEPEGVKNYFDIANSNKENNNCTHSINIANDSISVTSVNNGGIDGYLICNIDSYKGRTYKLTATSNNDKCFMRVMINNNRVGESSMKTKHEFTFTGENHTDNIVLLHFGIRGRTGGGTTPMTTIFNNIKIVDVNGDPDLPDEDGLKYSIENYKIVITDGTITERYDPCAEEPRGYGVDGFKRIIAQNKIWYLPLTSTVGSTSSFLIDGKKPYNHGTFNSEFYSSWSNRGYAVKNNTIKYTIKNSPTNPVHPVALTKALEIVNSMIPGKFVITYDPYSINEARETAFTGSDSTILGYCLLHNGEKFIADLNTNVFGKQNTSDAFIGILVHEIIHSTGIWDYNPDFPSIYNQTRNIDKVTYPQPSDIAYIKKKFAHLLK